MAPGSGTPRQGVEVVASMKATIPTTAERSRFSSLTSLRFVAAMTIVLYHYFALGNDFSIDDVAGGAANPISRGLAHYFSALTNGHLAVGFFFVLSGFVLAHAHFQELLLGHFQYVPFLKRRFSRIYPLFFIVTVGYGIAFLLALSLGVKVNHPQNFTWPAFLSNVFLLRGLGLIGHLTFDGPAWYVSSQWHLYLLFPLLAFCVLRSPLGKLGTLVATIALFLGMYYGMTGDQSLTQRTADFGILRAISEFPIGLALYPVFQDYKRSGSTFIRPMHVVGAGLAVLLAAQFDFADSVIILLLSMLIFVCAAAELHFEMKWLTQPWLIYGGNISYAIYLIHVPFLACARKAFPLLGASSGSLGEGLMLMACFVLMVPVAAIVCRWIEIPANQWTWNVLNRSAHDRAISAA